MKTITLKKLTRPTKRSGHKSVIGKAHQVSGFVITNVWAGEGWFIDRVTTKARGKK